MVFTVTNASLPGYAIEILLVPARILTNGKIDVRYKQEKMSESFSTVRHPRTAVGIRPDGSVVLVTVDGRQRYFLRHLLVGRVDFLR